MNSSSLTVVSDHLAAVRQKDRGWKGDVEDEDNDEDLFVDFDDIASEPGVKVAGQLKGKGKGKEKWRKTDMTE